MNRSKAALSGGLMTLALAAGASYAQAGGKTVWDGVYSEAQANDGASLYSQNCASCHGVNLGGTGEAPTLSGGEFMASYNGLTLGDLFDRIRTTMPFDRPGALSREEYAKITAHLLKFNGFPAGEKEMSGRSEMLATIRVASQKPVAGAGDQ